MLRRRGPIESVEQVPATAPPRRNRPQFLQQLRQSDAAEIRHTQHAYVSCRVSLRGKQRDDVRMLQPGQRQVLGGVVRRELQNYGAITKRSLASEKDRPLDA